MAIGASFVKPPPLFDIRVHVFADPQPGPLAGLLFTFLNPDDHSPAAPR